MIQAYHRAMVRRATLRVLFWLGLVGVAGCSSNTPPFDSDAGDAGSADGAADTGSKDVAAPDTGPGDGGTWDGYYAYGRSGNRIFLYKADAQRDLCFTLRLIAGPNQSALVLPAGWNVDASGVFHASAACNPQYMGAAEFLPTLSSSGTVDWSGSGIPTTITQLDVTLNFAPSLWAPSSEMLQTTNLAVK